MRRVVFEGCAGWLHEAGGDTGVVRCAPQGHEMLWSHRAWRHLADALAMSGVPVLRFDYRGTGDSADLEPGADMFGGALADIAAAVAALRSETHVTRVVLCGLRLGASLAALAAARGPEVSGVVMLAPVVNGRLYLRELRALHAGWRNSTIPELEVPPTPAGEQDVLSFRLSAATIAAIQAMRLDDVVPARRVLLLDAWPDAASPVAAMARQLGEAGVDVDMAPFAEYPEMMRSTEFAEVPVEAWKHVADWVKSGTARQPEVSASAEAAPDSANSANSAGDALAGEGMDGVVEHPVWLDEARMFGILCVPAEANARQANTVVIFPNTGGNHHIGDGRMFVDVSRQLARAGTAALRLDVSALGDSPAPARKMSVSAIYSMKPRADLAAAVDWARARGYGDVVVAGVCSGAFMGLYAALSNPGVSGLLLVNLVKFRWDEVDDAAVGDHLRSMRVYLAAARQWETWQRLFRGEINARRLLSATIRRVRQRVRDHVSAAGGRMRRDDVQQTMPEFAAAAVRELDRRGVPTMFLYGATDVGLHELRLGLGKHLEAIQGLRNVQFRTLPLLDHSLFLDASRQAFAEQLIEHLRWMSMDSSETSDTPEAAISFTPVTQRAA